jgi:LuxR family maltose regulon positive regulatory protein
LLDELDVVEAQALIGSGAPDEAGRIIDRVATGPRQRLLLAQVTVMTGAPQDVERLLGERAGWSVREQLDGDLIRATMPGNELAEQQVRAAVERAAATGWVSPFLGRGEALARLLGRVRVDELHPALGQALRRQPSPTRPVMTTGEDLTARETTILELLPTYMSYAQIGERLYLSINTVKGNLKTIYRKLGVTSRSGAVDAARRAGLV